MMRFIPKALILNRFFSGSATTMVGAVVAVESSVVAVESSVVVDTSPSVGTGVGALTGAGLESITFSVGEGVGEGPEVGFLLSLLGEVTGTIIIFGDGLGVWATSVGNGVDSGVPTSVDSGVPASVGSGVITSDTSGVGDSVGNTVSSGSIVSSFEGSRSLYGLNTIGNNTLSKR